MSRNTRHWRDYRTLTDLPVYEPVLREAAESCVSATKNRSLLYLDVLDLSYSESEKATTYILC